MCEPTLAEPIKDIQFDEDDAFVGELVNALAESCAECVELQSAGRDRCQATPTFAK